MLDIELSRDYNEIVLNKYIKEINMKEGLKEMSLVTGTVTYKVQVSLLVPKEDAENELHMNEVFEERAYENISSSNCESEYIDEIPVLLSKETAEKFNYSVISDSWSQIINESKKNKKAK